MGRQNMQTIIGYTSEHNLSDSIMNSAILGTTKPAPFRSAGEIVVFRNTPPFKRGAMILQKTPTLRCTAETSLLYEISLISSGEELALRQ